MCEYAPIARCLAQVSKDETTRIPPACVSIHQLLGVGYQKSMDETTRIPPACVSMHQLLGVWLKYLRMKLLAFHQRVWVYTNC